MSKKTSIELFLGTDKIYTLHVKNSAETASIDINGWTMSFMIKQYKDDTDAEALLTKTTGSGITIAGTFNATPASNAQRATVTIADTDTNTKWPGLFYWEAKRTDDGFEVVTHEGPIRLRRGVHR